MTLSWGANIKYAPLAFTEHGAVMAASVLNSPNAVEGRRPPTGAAAMIGASRSACRQREQDKAQEW